MDLASCLEQLQQEIDSWRASGGCGNGCGPHAVGKATYYVGRTAQLAVVGAVPGPRTMWLTGKPFFYYSPAGELRLSQAGQHLERCLEPLGFKVLDILFLDAVKCRPEGTRGNWRPTEKTQRNCLRWLRVQFQLTQPRLVFPLGEIAIRSCYEALGFSLPSSNIGPMIGSVYSGRTPWGDCHILPLWHPSGANPRGAGNPKYITRMKERLSKLLTLEQ